MTETEVTDAPIDSPRGRRPPEKLLQISSLIDTDRAHQGGEAKGSQWPRLAVARGPSQAT